TCALPISSHWASTSARSPTPTRSSRATAAIAGAVGAGEAVAPAGAVADLVVVASEPVPAPVAAGPAPEPVAGPTADRGPAEPAGRTSVVGCTDTTPSGAVAVTVSSVVLHCMPRRLRRVRAASAVGKSGPRSRGSSVTES